LLSGNPVTFRQALYESYYVPRPAIPVESGSRVLPPADTGSVGAVALDEAREQKAAKAAPGLRRDMAGMAQAAPVGAVPPVQSPPVLPAQIEAGSAAEEATQIAFTAPYKINVAAGQSLVLPLLDRALPSRRLGLYQPSVSGH